MIRLFEPEEKPGMDADVKPEMQTEETAPAENAWTPWSVEPRYSQPKPSYIPMPPPIVRAGFMRDGSPGFLVSEFGAKKLIRVEATPQNRAKENPRGFFSSLARLYHGGPR